MAMDSQQHHAVYLEQTPIHRTGLFGTVQITMKMESSVDGKAGSNVTVLSNVRGRSWGSDHVTALLAISLTVHGCVLCYLITRAVFSRLAAKKPAKGFWRFLRLHQQQDWVLPKIFTEQLTTWLLIPAAVVGFVHDEVVTCPFVPEVSRDIYITRTILCVNLGRYIYKCVQDMLLCAYLERFKVDILHHVVALVYYSVFIWNNENLLLGLVGVVMESDTLLRDIIYLRKKLGCDRFSFFMKALHIWYTVVALVARGIIPVAFVVVSLVTQDVMSMHFASISFWFLGLVFFGAFGGWIVAQALLRLRRTLCEHAVPLDKTSCPEVVASSSGKHKGQMPQNVVPTKPKSPTKSQISLNFRNDMSYLNPFSNVNINDNSNSVRHNLTNKKLKPKTNVNDIAHFLKTCTASRPAIIDNDLATSVHPMQTSGSTGTGTVCIVDINTDVPEVIDQVVVETRLADNCGGVEHVIVSGESSRPPAGGHRVHSPPNASSES